MGGSYYYTASVEMAVPGYSSCLEGFEGGGTEYTFSRPAPAEY